MNRLTIICTLLLSSAIFSSPSSAAWTEVATNVDGDTFYMDFDRIRKHGGYVYFWELTDSLKPTSTGRLSHKAYFQGDCRLFRSKPLSFSFHKEPMGGGAGEVLNVNDGKWLYPSPDSVNEILLTLACK